MASNWDHQSYYEILEVAPDAPESEIRIAYHRAKQTYSQDNPALLSVFTKEETQELLKLVEEAYSTLSHTGSRNAYDQRLKRERGDTRDDHVAENFLRNTLDNGEGSTSSVELPEFEFDEESLQETMTTTATNTPPQKSQEKKESPNTGKTLLSTYEVDPDVEETIENEEQFRGDFLKMVREYKSVDLDQISDHTRIGKYYLRAIETEDFDRLPAPVFVRGFLVQLAKIFSLNEEKLCKTYLSRLKNHKKQ